jgi:IclR family KDG regulon transcriptional repressor
MSTTRIQAAIDRPHADAPAKGAAVGVRALTSPLKTLAVLDALGASQRSMRLAEVVAAVGGNRGSVYQRLLTLVEAGWAEDDGHGGYRLSLHANRVGHAALAQAGLGTRGTPMLQALVYETNETASLALLDGRDAYIAQRVEAAGVLRAELRIGTSLRLETSASGRVLSAFADPAQLEHLRASRAVLPGQSVMARIRRDGYAVSSGLDFAGVRAIAAPVLDGDRRCVAALSLVAPEARFDEAKLRKPLLRAAEQFQRLLAGS